MQLEEIFEIRNGCNTDKGQFKIIREIPSAVDKVLRNNFVIRAPAIKNRIVTESENSYANFSEELLRKIINKSLESAIWNVELDEARSIMK